MKHARWITCVAAMTIAVVVCAEQAVFTGVDYLKLSKTQRVEAVKRFETVAKQQGITITKDPIFYCMRLDTFYAKHPAMQKESLDSVIKTLVIMEYDWSQKGVDKDTLAKQWLGNDLYTANKARINKK